eukprot:g15808.t1
MCTVNGTLHSCNGESSAYYVGDDTWNTTYISNDGDELEIDVFYATYQNQLWVRHLQPHMDPSLYNVLNDTMIRLNITCGSGRVEYNGCLEFTANFTEATPYNYTTPFEFQDDCSHGFSDGIQVPTVQVHAASPIGPSSSATLGAGNTLILAGKADQGLPWSEGFYENGTQKDDEFWAEFWATVSSRYNPSGSSDSSDSSDASSTDPCVEYGGKPDPQHAVCCHSDCDTCEDSSNHFQNNRVCSRSMMLSGYDYGTCGVDVMEAPCELPENALTANEETACTSSLAQSWDPRTGTWRDTFQTLDSESHDIDMFYLNQVDGMNELWVTEIESWMAPSLYNQLQYNYVKLSITCPEENVVTESCVIFKPTFTNWSPDVDGAMAGYRFADPALPSFDLPEAVPNSPGDVVVTTDNAVVTKTGAATETYCNGDSLEYYGEDGNWYNSVRPSP